MPSHTLHKTQANHNAALAKDLIQRDGAPCFDWVATISFYAALHYVMAVFEEHHPVAKFYGFEEEVSADIRSLVERHKLNKTPHKVQCEILKMNFQSIFLLYHPLYKLADNARYHCYNVSELEAKKSLDLLNGIKKWCRDFKAAPKNPV